MLGSGKYLKTCRYCGVEFKTDWQHQAYCTPTHKTYDYRRRRSEKSLVEICRKCGKPWKEPKASGTGLKPHYCAACQDYFASRYKGQNA